MKRLLFAKSMLRLGEISFGAGLLSYWFTEGPAWTKLATASIVMLVYFFAFLLTPSQVTRGEINE